MTVAMSQEEIAIFAQPDLLDVQRIQQLTREQFDIWLIEGERHADHPKVFVTRFLEEFSEGMPENIVATIGPERIDGVAAHFETGDYAGLGSLVINSMLDKKKGTSISF